MKTYRVKNESGQTFEVDEDKIGEAEKDGFLPVVSNGKQQHRVSFADLPKAKADGYKTWNDLASEGEAMATQMAEVKDKYDKPLGVAVRSVTRGLSADFADEIGGALGAVADQLKGSDKTFAESYKENRDYERLKQRVDDINHPVATTVGRIGGGVASGGLLPGAASLGGSVGYGAAQGVGASEAEDIEGVAKDAAIGGALGAGGYGAGKVIQKIPDAVKSTKDMAKNAIPSVKAGAYAMTKGGSFGEDAIDAAMISSGLPPINRMWRGVKAGWDESKALSAAKGEFDEAVGALSKTFGPGSAANLSDNDILMQKLLEKGIAGQPNQAHQLVATKFAQAHGGNADQYLKLLTRSPEELSAARAFNAIEAGEELAPKFDDAYKTLKSETSNRYRALSDEARNQFQKVDATPIKELQSVLKTIEDDTTISATSKNYIREGLKRLGDDFADQDAATQFDRLVAAKDKLKGGAKWAGRNEVPEGASAVRDASNTVDKYLKALESRKTADAEWTTLSRLEDGLFKKVGIVKGGKVQSIDPIKLEKIFSGTATGRQLMKEVAKAEEILAKGTLPPDKVASISGVIDTIKKYAENASLKREINAFRFNDAGPSSPAIQRMQAIAGKDTAVDTATRAPQLFLNMKAAASDAAQKMYGKTFSQLSVDEQKAVAKYAMWIVQNDGADPTTMSRMIQNFKDPKFKP